ncbi:hypothetical protein ACFL2J_00340 [Candidatus Omnitrophota bacterium]
MKKQTKDKRPKTIDHSPRERNGFLCHSSVGEVFSLWSLVYFL